MNVNFALTGILILIFALGLVRNVHGGTWFRIGIIFLMVGGATEAATGVFPCDPGCPPQTGSFSQNAHLGIALVFFPSIAFAPLLVGLGRDQDQFWKSHRAYSIVSGLAGVGFGVGFSIAVLYSLTYVGLLQRLFLAFPFQWIGIMANHLRFKVGP